MGLGDFTATVLTKYKADTSDHRREVKKLRGDQRKAAKEQLEALERQNQKIEGHISTIGKIGIAVGAIGAAWYGAQKAIDAYAKRSDLTIASKGADIDRLQQSFAGLRTETQSLEFAAQLMNGAFKVSEEQMLTAAQAVIALKRQGNDLAEVQRDVSQALVEGNGEALKKYGINIKAAADTTEGFNAVMKALEGQANSTYGGMATDAEKAQQAQVELKDSLENLAVTFGELAVKMEPLLTGLADMLSTAIDIVAWVGSGFQVEKQKELANLKELEARMAENESAWRFGELDKVRNQIATLEAEIEQERRKQRDQARREMEEARRIAEQNRLAAEHGGAYDPSRQLDIFGAGAGGGGGGGGRGGVPALPPLPTEMDFSMVGAGGAREFGASLSGGLLAGDTAALLERQQAIAAQMELAQKTSRLEQIFGPVSEFDAYVTAFGMLENAVKSAVAAWVDGSKSLGEAVKAAIASSAASLAAEAAIQTLRHAAYAIGHAALGDFATATMHGKAAAAWGAAGILAAVTARELGGDARTPSAGASAGASAGGSVGGSGGGTSNTTVIVGDSFADDSPRRRALQTQRALDLAKREGTGSRTVRFS